MVFLKIPEKANNFTIFLSWTTGIKFLFVRDIENSYLLEKFLSLVKCKIARTLNCMNFEEFKDISINVRFWNNI